MKGEKEKVWECDKGKDKMKEMKNGIKERRKGKRWKMW